MNSTTSPTFASQLEDLESLFDLEEDKLRERLDAVLVGKAV